MIIRKLFKFEGSHIVRNCSSDRCKYSIHGHSYKVEVLLSGSDLDNGQMIVDFGLLKSTVKELIDSFDHCHVVWAKDNHQYIADMKKHSSRWISTPLSPSAESLSIMIYGLVKKVLDNTIFANGEPSDLVVDSVIVHETDTGYAQAFYSDYKMAESKYHFKVNDIVFSAEVMDDWADDTHRLWGGGTISNSVPEQQVTI